MPKQILELENQLTD